MAPNYDATISPRETTKQGPLLRGEWRQRFEDGDLTIRGAGIDQLDKNYFIRSDGSTTPGYRDWRSSIESSGHFALSPQWMWGWDALGVSDASFFQDYKIVPLQSKSTDPLLNALDVGVNQLYLMGRGDRSFFDIRGIHYYGFSQFDYQGELPVVLPVIDYNYTFDQPVLGGELSTASNFLESQARDREFHADFGLGAGQRHMRLQYGGSCAQDAIQLRAQRHRGKLYARVVGGGVAVPIYRSCRAGLYTIRAGAR